jgi:excisionase family DNA binding protein
MKTGKENARNQADMKSRKEELIGSGLLTVREAGTFLRLSRTMLYKLMENGELEYVKIGRSRRIPKMSITILALGNLAGGWRLPHMQSC